MAPRFAGCGLAVLTVVALLATATPASARIVPQKGIAGARVGMEQKRVRKKLGRPDSERIRTSPIGGFKFIQLKYGKTRISFDGVRSASKVLSVMTRDRSERTKRGVGVGSTRREVKQSVPGVTCAVEFGLNHCYLGKFVSGRIVTDFVFGKKPGKPARVRQVAVARVLD